MIFLTSFVGKDGHTYSGCVDAASWEEAQEYVRTHPRGVREDVEGFLGATITPTDDGPITMHHNVPAEQYIPEDE